MWPFTKKPPVDPAAVTKALEITNLQLVIHPDPVLKKKCQEVVIGELLPTQSESFREAAILGMQMSLWLAAYNSSNGRRLNAVGLAANQIGVSKRVFVMMPTGKRESATICINPVIIRTGREQVQETESCMSLPEKKAPVKRAAVLTVAFWNERGEREEKVLKRWEARIFQHEMDHLNGKLCVEAK